MRPVRGLIRVRPTAWIAGLTFALALACTGEATDVPATDGTVVAPVPTEPPPAPEPKQRKGREGKGGKRRPVPAPDGKPVAWWATTYLAEECKESSCWQHLLLLDPGGSAYLASSGPGLDHQVIGKVRDGGARIDVECLGGCEDFGGRNIEAGKILVTLEKTGTDEVRTTWTGLTPKVDFRVQFATRTKLDEGKRSKLPAEQCCCAVSIDDGGIEFSVDPRKTCYDGHACVPIDAEAMCE